jgi:hypothetical protein
MIAAVVVAASCVSAYLLQEIFDFMKGQMQ